MRIYIEDDNGVKHEINKIEGLGEGDNLLLQLKNQTTTPRITRMQTYLTDRLKKTVTIFPSDIEVIGTI